MSHLYELTGQYLALLEAIDAGEIPLEAIADTLDAVEGEFEQKAENIACLIKEKRAEALMHKQEEDAQAAMRKAADAAADSLEEYLFRQCQAVGKTKISTARAQITLRKTAPKVVFEGQIGSDPAAAFVRWAMDEGRMAFIRQKDPEPDKTNIKKALQDGMELPFVRLESGTSITIK